MYTRLGDAVEVGIGVVVLLVPTIVANLPLLAVCVMARHWLGPSRAAFVDSHRVCGCLRVVDTGRMAGGNPDNDVFGSHLCSVDPGHWMYRMVGWALDRA
jgi:hypothetical protein